MKVVMCGKFRVAVVEFDWWMWEKILFVGFEEANLHRV